MSLKSMDEENMEVHIKDALARLRVSEGTKEEADILWQMPVERADPDAWFLRGTDAFRAAEANKGGSGLFRSGLFKAGLAAAAALFLLGILSWYQFFLRADTVICMDVNPSLTITSNRMGRVIRAKADNPEGEALLADTDLEGKRTEEAMDLLLRTMQGAGYLNSEDAVLLISLECMSASRSAGILEEIEERTEAFLLNELGGGMAFFQTVRPTDEVREFASGHSLSAGRAALILKLAGRYRDLHEEELAALSVSELVSYLHESDIDLRDMLDYRGEDLSRRWQNQEEEEAEPSSAGSSSGQEEEPLSQDAEAAGPETPPVPAETVDPSGQDPSPASDVRDTTDPDDDDDDDWDDSGDDDLYDEDDDPNDDDTDTSD